MARVARIVDGDPQRNRLQGRRAASATGAPRRRSPSRRAPPDGTTVPGRIRPPPPPHGRNARRATRRQPGCCARKEAARRGRPVWEASAPQQSWRGTSWIRHPAAISRSRSRRAVPGSSARSAQPVKIATAGPDPGVVRHAGAGTAAVCGPQRASRCRRSVTSSPGELGSEPSRRAARRSGAGPPSRRRRQDAPAVARATCRARVTARLMRARTRGRSSARTGTGPAQPARGVARVCRCSSSSDAIPLGHAVTQAWQSRQRSKLSRTAGASGVARSCRSNRRRPRGDNTSLPLAR